MCTIAGTCSCDEFIVYGKLDTSTMTVRGFAAWTLRTSASCESGRAFRGRGPRGHRRGRAGLGVAAGRSTPCPCRTAGRVIAHHDDRHVGGRGRLHRGPSASSAA